MEKHICSSKDQLGMVAAKQAFEAIKKVLERKGKANVVLATGASQLATLENLTRMRDIEWFKVTMFHLDEYIGLGKGHPASFRKYLKERFIEKVGKLAAVYLIDGDTPDPDEECRRLGQIMASHPIDVSLVGIGENGHLAFNDPPADFDTKYPYIIVTLDERCRQQQRGEGWFDSLEEVPQQAISMSVRQIMKSDCIIASVPDRRKAQAVKGSLEGELTNMCPASILQEHPNCKIFLDPESASLLS